MSSHQSMLGPNLLFSAFLPYMIATALQDTHLQLGLAIAVGIAGGHVILGAVLVFMRARHVYPYIYEVCMLAIYPVLLGVSYSSDHAKEVIQRDYDFIVHSTLAGVTVISMIITYPAGLPHVQELVPWVFSSHEAVLHSGLWTSAVLCATFTINCLLYLIPICRGVDTHHMNALNLIFRIILPMCLTFLALLFTRFWPATLLAGLQNSGVYDASRPLPNPPPYPVRILDNAMFAPPVKSADLWTGKPVAPTAAQQYAAAGYQGRPVGQVQPQPYTNTGAPYTGGVPPGQQQQGSLPLQVQQQQQQQALGYPVSQSVPQAMAYAANNSLSARPVHQQPQLPSPPGTPQYAHAMMLPNQSYNPMTPTYQPAQPSMAYNNPTFMPGQPQQQALAGAVNPANGVLLPQVVGGPMQQQGQGVVPGAVPPQAQPQMAVGQVLQPQNSGPPLQSLRGGPPLQQIGGQQPQGGVLQQTAAPGHMLAAPQGAGLPGVPPGGGPQQAQHQGPTLMLTPQGGQAGMPQQSTGYSVPGQHRAFSSAAYDARR